MSVRKSAKQPAFRVFSEALLNDAMEGRIRLGDKLPTEETLCIQFGVNRSTVREGIRLLEAAGVLSRESGKRFFISKPSEAHVSRQLQQALILNKITFDEIWEAVTTLEPPMARLAASRRSAELLAKLDRNLAETELALLEDRPLVELDMEFHKLVAAAADSDALSLSREPFVQLFYPAYEAVLAAVPKAAGRLLTAHRNILEALRRKDQTMAEVWMTRHLQDFKRGAQIARIDMSGPITQRPPRPTHRKRGLRAEQ